MDAGFLMFQEKAEQKIESAPDAEGIDSVVQSLYVADPDSPKCFLHRRIAAFFEEEPSGIGKRSGDAPENRGKTQKGLIYNIVVQLFFHVWIERGIDDL